MRYDRRQSLTTRANEVILAMRPVAQAYFSSPNRAVSIASRYGLAVVSVAIALGLALLLHSFPISIFLMAVAITVWYGRMGAGLLAIVLSMLCLDIFFLPRLQIQSGTSHLRYFTLFTLFALLISWLSASRRRAEQALEQARNELEQKVTERTAELQRTTSEAVVAQQRFRELVDSIVGIVWEADAESFAFSFVSQQAERMLGYPVEMWSKEPTFWKDHLHPEDRDRAVQVWMETAEQQLSHEVEYRMIAADGRVIWMRDLVSVVVENGRATRLRGVIVNITRRKTVEEALRRSEAYLAEAQKLTHTGSWAISPVAQTAFWSEESFRIFGFDLENGVPPREKYWERVHPEDRQRARECLEKSVSGTTDFSDEFRIVLPDGTIRHVQVSGHPVFGESGDLIEVFGTHVDVTERKRAEEERERLRILEADLARINRVTTMGELTASLAHEINQPIAATVMNADTCLQWLAAKSPNIEEAREAAKRIVKDSHRAAEIISRLRSLFKKGSAQREPVQINEIIGEIVMLLRNEAARSRVSIRTELAKNAPVLVGDRVQLQQVVMNLMVNAIDAMKSIDYTRELTVRSQLNGSNHLLVSVSDTGVGLPPETNEIFNAFFTTKPHGTGMGLAISRTIIESHGGRLWASSNSGRGAVFSFTLPISVEAHPTTSEAHA